MPKKYIYSFSEGWLEEIVKSTQQQKSQGLKPILSHLLQSLLNSIMLKERESFLKSHPENSSNGFYHRNLYLSFGNLNLKSLVSNSETPSDPSSFLPWKCVNKDYKELLIAMLVNGYSKAQIQRTLKKLGLPPGFSLTLFRKNSTSTALNHLNQIGLLSSLMPTGLKLKTLRQKLCTKPPYS